MKIIKTFWPQLGLFFVWLIFAFPYILMHKTPFPSSYQVNNFAPWSAYSQFASPVKNGAMPDLISQIVPWRFFSVSLLKNREIPLWNPYSFSGTPHLANYQSSVLNPLNILFFLFPFNYAWGLLVILQPFLAAFFMYLYVSQIKFSRTAKFISSIAFMFCGFLVTWMSYATLAFAIIFLPLALFSIEKYFQTRNSRYLLLLSLTFPLSFFSGHFQTSIYFLIGSVAYTFFKMIQTKDIYIGLKIFLMTFFGILLTLPQVIPSAEFYTQSLRSGIFQKSEVIPWMYLPTIIAPDFFGNPVTRNDWFGHYAEWNTFIGFIPFLLSFFALLKLKNSYIRFFLIFGVIALLFALPTPLNDLLLFLHVPVLSTSSASRIIALFCFSFAVLAGFGFDALVDATVMKRMKQILPVIILFTLIFSVIWIMILGKLFLPYDKIVIARQNFILPSILFFIFVFSILVSTIFKKRGYEILSIIIILLVTFDLVRFTTKWMPSDPINLMFTRVSAANYLGKIPKTDRVLGNIEAGECTFFGISCLDGYDPLYIDRYGTFVYSLSTNSIQHAERSVVNFPKSGENIIKAINLLGVSYILHKTSDDFALWTFPYWDYPSQFIKKFDDGKYKIFKNVDAFPRAFLVNDYKVITDDKKIIKIMFDKETNLRNTIFLEEDPKLVLGQQLGFAKLTSYKTSDIRITTDTQGTNLLFLSDPYYPGWNAYVDGKEVKIYRADFAFRGVIVPGGKHEVEFKYLPQSFKIGVYSSLIGILGLISTGFLLRKRK